LFVGEEYDSTLTKAPANLVPAAAVIRGGQALFSITRRKVFVGGKISC
jgi:hypothetical protein